MFEEEDESNSDGTVTDCEDEEEIEVEIEMPHQEEKVVLKKKKKTSHIRFQQSYLKELLEAMVNFDRYAADDEQMAYVKAFAEKYPPVKPKKTTAAKRTKVSYDYFRESKLRNEYKGMSIAESAPLIAQEWRDVKSNAERRKVWDDMVVVGGGSTIKKAATKDPYGLFAEQERNILLQKNPDLSKEMINKECRKRWRDLEDREKGVWYAKKAKICEA
jgi:hypothetical protein